MAIVPGSSLAVVANANVNLDEEEGSLVGVDLSTRSILSETSLPIRNFAGRVLVDSTRSRIYLPDRGDDALLVFDYQIPGSNGEPISFVPSSIPRFVDEVANGLPTDESPFDAYLAPGTPSGDLLFVTNSRSGSVSVIPSADFSLLDLDPEESDLEGLPLISAANFKSKDRKPGIGANRIVPTPDGKLLYVTNTQTNQIYVIDTEDQQVEAMLDLSSLSRIGGSRGMAIASNQLAYIAHRGLGGVLVLDVSFIKDNGIDFEVADTRFVDILVTGRDPEGIALSTDEKRLFVSNQGDDTVDMIDLTTRTIALRIFLNQRTPGELLLDSARGVIYVLNFLSNSISVIDENSGALIGTIQ